MNACPWKPTLVTLHDGRQVASDSEEWRHEAEALTVLAMPTLAARRAFLRGELDLNGTLRGGIMQKRGAKAVEQLEKTIMSIWRSRQAKR